jgi:hypothetical protein
MRKLLGQVVMALVLFAVGFIVWRVGQLQNTVAEAHQELALLRYNSATQAYAEIEQSTGYIGGLPWVSDVLLPDVRGDRAVGDYWLARYDALGSRRDAAGGQNEQPAGELELAANAGFRVSQRDGADRGATLARLDAAIKTYTELLKKNGRDADAAYNYEYVVRLRDTLSKAKPQAPGKREDPAKVVEKLTGVTMAGDLPDGRTVHGDPGAPPPNTDMTQFKMHIPVRPDERQGGSDAGQGKEKIRKG